MHIHPDKLSHSRCTNFGVLPFWHKCVQRQNQIQWFVERSCFPVNILFAWRDCLPLLAERTARLAPSPLVNTTAESLFELAGGSGWLYVLVVDLKLCNQEWKWSAAWGVFQGSVGNYWGGTQLLLCLCLYPFSTSTAVLKLPVWKKKKKKQLNNLSRQVSVWMRRPLHFSALNWPFSTFLTTINPEIQLNPTSSYLKKNKEVQLSLLR